MHFLQFCADLSKISQSIKTICMYASERSRYALSENAMTYCFGDIRVLSRRISAESASFFCNLVANISGSYKPYHFLKV